jgi:tetratricopeptide (TPR) repeat protein
MLLARVLTMASLFISVPTPVLSQASPPSPLSSCQEATHDVAHILRCAESYEQQGHRGEAIEWFQAVLKLDRADTTAGQRVEATTGLLRATTILPKSGSLMDIVWLQVTRFPLSYSVPFALLVVLLLFRFRGYVFPRRGIVVSLSDLNAESGAASSSSRSLTAELLILLEDPEPLAVKGLKMNTMPGTGQPAFGVVRPAEAMTRASDFSSSRNPIKLGGIEFGLDDIVRILTWLFGFPREGTLVGWLSCGQNSAVASAELTRRGFRRSLRRRHCSWRATATGEHAREEVLAAIASQILVDTRGNRFTDSWQSLKACQDGIKIMRADGGTFDSAKARRFFENALDYDSANWIARFYLALSLCGEDKGKPATALRHFQILDQVLREAQSEPAFKDRARVKLAEVRRQRLRRVFLDRRARIRAYFRSRRFSETLGESPRLTGLIQHLVNYPECPFILQYNVAIAVDELCRTSGGEELKPFSGKGVHWTNPLESLKEIAALRDHHGPWKGDHPQYAELLGQQEKLELSLYAQSARAHIMSLHAEVGTVAAITELLNDIDGVCRNARERNRCLNLRIHSWRAIETTKAVALASLGRVLWTAKGFAENQEARDRLYEAITAEPHLVDAYVQLADLYIRWQDKFAMNWRERAISLLTRAHEMNPKCVGAKALMSKLREITAEAGQGPLSRANTA